MKMTLREHLDTATLVLDGAMGTQLMAFGARGNNELWGVEHPEELKSIHRAYIDAGSTAVVTDTFGGSRVKLDKAGLGDRTVELNRRLAEIAKEAAAGDAFVLGDVGPTGEFIEPLGTITEDEMIAIYQEQMEALHVGGVDGFIIETMMDPGEAVCAIRAARKVSADIPILATMTFEKNPTGFRTMMGTTPEQGAKAMTEAGADAIGANCGGITPDQFIELLKELRAATDLPLIAEPNAGLPEIEDGETVFNESPDTFARLAIQYRSLGVAALGGCCGTTPDHIRALAKS
jgi:5-methyltetrahydrofolate--homocysteine methyltransferase